MTTINTAIRSVTRLLMVSPCGAELKTASTETAFPKGLDWCFGRPFWKRWMCLFVFILSAIVPASGQKSIPALATTLAATDATWKMDSRGLLVDPTCLPPTWASQQNLAPAKWIWARSCIAKDDESHTFSTSFSLTESGSKVELDIAVDNFAFVSVNGQRLQRIDGYDAATTVDISKYVHSGSNLISIEAHNLAIGVSAGWDNPAGLLARVVLTGANDCKPGTTRAIGKATTKTWRLPDPSGTIDIQITSSAGYGGYAIPGGESILTAVAKAINLLGDVVDEVPGGEMLKIPMKYFEELAKDGGEITQAGKRLSDKNGKKQVDLLIKIPIIERSVECASAEVCKDGKWVPAGVKMIGNPNDKKTFATKQQDSVLEGEIPNVMNAFVEAQQRTLSANQKAYDANPCQGVVASPTPIGGTAEGTKPKEDCDRILKEIQDIRAEAIPPADEKITRAERDLREWVNARDDIRKRQFQEAQAAEKILNQAQSELKAAKERKQNLESNPNTPDAPKNLALATTRIANAEADVKVKEKANEDAHNRFLHNVDEETLRLEKLLSIAKAARVELDQKIARLQIEYDACKRRNQ